MTNPAARRLCELEKENRELKQLVADGLLRERILMILVEKTLSSRVLRELLPAVMTGASCSWVCPRDSLRNMPVSLQLGLVFKA